MYATYEVIKMLKKITCIVLLLLLCGCQTKKEDAKEVKKNEITIKSNLAFKHLRDGDGTEEGFYHVAYRDVEGTVYSNIYYYDYKTKKEIFLCDRPECTHMDKNCPSYVEGDSFTSFVFVKGAHIYLIQHLSNNQATEIIEMGLDGKHHRHVATLPEHFEFENSEIALSEQTLYLPVSKIAYKSMGDGTTLQVNADKKIIAINLEDGSIETLIDMNKRKKEDLLLIGADHQQLIFKKNTYKKDPNALLEAKDFKTYDQVMLHPELSYVAYDIQKKSFGSDVKSVTKMLGAYHQNHIYEINDDGELYQLSLTKKDTRIISNFPSGIDYTIAEIRDDHIIIDAYGNSDTQKHAYSFDLRTKKQKQITLMTSEIKQRVKIMGENQDYFFVYYDHDEQKEISWAGNEQYSIKKYYYGLITKKDYWNNKAKYIPVKMISQRL